jgi:hypothetical protein
MITRAREVESAGITSASLDSVGHRRISPLVHRAFTFLAALNLLTGAQGRLQLAARSQLTTKKIKRGAHQPVANLERDIKGWD